MEGKVKNIYYTYFFSCILVCISLAILLEAPLLQGTLFAIMAIGMAMFFHQYCISHNSWQDFFNKKDEEFKNVEDEYVILSGEKIYTYKEEEESEERFMRVESYTNRLNRAISTMLLVAALSFIVIKVFKTSSNLQFYFLVTGLGALLINSKTIGQLLSPLFALIIYLGLAKIEVLEASMSSFLLVFSIILSLSVFSLLERETTTIELKKNSSFYENIITILIKAAGAGIVLLCFWLFFDYIIPEYKNEVKRTDPIEKGIKKLNKKLGKKFKAPIPKISPEFGNIPGPLQQNVDIGDFIGKARSNLNNLESLIEKSSLDLSNLPSMETYQMKNEISHLKNDLKRFEDMMAQNQNFSEQDLVELQKLFQDIDRLSKKMSINSPSGNLGDTDELPNGNLFKDSQESLKKGIQGNKEFFEGLKKIDGFEDSPEYNDFLSKSNTLAEKIESGDSSSLENDLKELNEANSQAQKKYNELAKKKESLIDELTLEKFIQNSKKAILAFVLFVIASFIYNFFKKPKKELKEDSDESTKKNIRKLLRRKRYKSIDEEVADLYNRYEQAIKELLFHDDEVPPPKILNRIMSQKYKKNKKYNDYFTEVFSRNFYGKRKVSDKIIKNYRKSFRAIFKDL